MLKINKKLQLPLIFLVLGISGFFLYQYLTFIPKYSQATTASTVPVTPPATLPEISGEITTKFGTAEQGYKTYMQEIDLNYCQSLPDGTTGQLADGRDGKIYWVTVIKGTCWMTQDLDLDLGPNGPKLTIENTGSNLYKGTSLDEETQTEWTGGKSVVSTSSGWPTSGNTTVNWYERDTAHGTEYTSLGNLYSYQAATAGTGSSVISSNVEAPGSICPAGWKLPIGGSSTATGSFNGLGLTASNVTGTPYYFQMGGYIYGSLVSVGNSGIYWSATSNYSGSAYRLYFDSSNINTTSDIGRYRGFSVRCVVRDTNYTAPTIPTPSDTDITDPTLSVQVPNIITLDVSDSVSIETKTDDVSEGSFTASVSSNTPYSITLSTTNGGHTDLRNENGSGAIPTLTSSQALAPGISAWGIKCTNPTNSTNCIQTSYTGLTDYLNPILFFKSTTGGLNLPTTFQIGITVSPDLPSDTYTTDVLVTAATSD